MHDTHKGR
jgi:hypothetical protein